MTSLRLMMRHELRAQHANFLTEMHSKYFKLTLFGNFFEYPLYCSTSVLSLTLIILIIALASRPACLNRSWSRVLPRLITAFLNLFFTLIRFRSSWSIHGCSFIFRGLLVGMCWSTAARNVSDQFVSEAFMLFSSKHRSQLIKLSEYLRPFQSAFLKLYSRRLTCGFWLLIRRSIENSVSWWSEFKISWNPFMLEILSGIFVSSKSNKLSFLVGKSISCRRKWSLIALVKMVYIWQSVEAVTVAQSTFGRLKSPTIKSWSNLALDDRTLCFIFIKTFERSGEAVSKHFKIGIIYLT